MRESKQYSIVDHEVLHGGYFQSLSHEALVLYFFLITVGNKDGVSYYSETKIIEILKLSYYKIAVASLLKSKLIDYQRPYFRVKNFVNSSKNHNQATYKKNIICQNSENNSLGLNLAMQSAKEVLRNILKD